MNTTTRGGVSGFRFRVSSVGFWVSDLWFEVDGGGYPSSGQWAHTPYCRAIGPAYDRFAVRFDRMATCGIGLWADRDQGVGVGGLDPPW